MKTQYEFAMEEIRLSREFLGLFKDDFFYERGLDKFLGKQVFEIIFVNGEGEDTYSAANKFAKSFGNNSRGYRAVNSNHFDTVFGEIYDDEMKEWDHKKENASDDDYNKNYHRKDFLGTLSLDKKKKDLLEHMTRYGNKMESDQQFASAMGRKMIDSEHDDMDYIDVVHRSGYPIILITENEHDPLISKLGLHKTTKEKIFDR